MSGDGHNPACRFAHAGYGYDRKAVVPLARA